MAVLKYAAVGAAALILLAGCGDTFRPVANPVITPGGNPTSTGNAIVVAADPVSTDNPNGFGTTTNINLSGDTVAAINIVGKTPVHAAIIGGQVVVANRDSGTVSLYSVSAGGNTSVLTASLVSTNPSGAPLPVFVASTDNTNVYVAQSGRNSVGIVPLSGAGPTEIPSIPSPVSIAQLPNGGEIYVANQGPGTVTVIDPASQGVKGTPVPVGTSPSWLVASSDGNCVYVADTGSNDVAVISTAGGVVPKPAPKFIGVGNGPSFLLFDSKLQRVYVANKTGGSISIIAHSADCNSTLLSPATIPVGINPQSIAALSDGTRAYVANADGTVTVINTSSNTVRKTISTIAAPITSVASIGASADGTKVIVANSFGNVSAIQTSDDTVIPKLTLMPTKTANGVLTSAGANPQFVLMNP